MPQLSICESLASIFAYHLSEDGGRHSLCGRTDMMPTNIPVRTWGLKTHLHEIYCRKCAYGLDMMGSPR
jgi:hypothetical protein